MTVIVLPTLAYTLGYLFTFRRIAGQLAWHMMAAKNSSYSFCNYKNPTGEHWFGAICSALFFSIIWPLALPVAYALEGSKTGTGIFYCPKDKKYELQKARIADLEREVGIR